MRFRLVISALCYNMKVAFIGYRNQAKRLMCLVDKLNLCRQFLVYYPDYQTLLERFTDEGISCKIKLTSSLKDIYEVDAVFIASPTHTHWYYLERLQKEFSGYIFCEKPPCKKIEELDAILELDKKAKSRIFFNFNYRNSIFAQVCKSAIDNGKFGVPISLSFHSSHGLAFKQSFTDNWRNLSNDILENVIGNVGIHYIDLAFYLMGGGERGYLHTTKISEYTEYSDSALITLMTRTGLPTTILLSYAAPFRNTATMMFSNGIIELKDGVVSSQTPRDCFDGSGLFCPPSKEVIKAFTSSREYYNNSIMNTISEFFKIVQGQLNCSMYDFSCSVETTRFLLKLQKSNLSVFNK